MMPMTAVSMGAIGRPTLEKALKPSRAASVSQISPGAHTLSLGTRSKSRSCVTMSAKPSLCMQAMLTA